MKVNKTYRALLDKSIDSMLSAIEIYNKPNFNYREETFAVLAINSWELLLKAYLLKLNRYVIKSLYVLEPILKKDGNKHKTRKKPKVNRCGNPMSISIVEALNKLEAKGKLPQNLKANIEALIELRDNSIHFVNVNSISHQLQELGFACINNYISVIKNWNLEIDISRYNLYLMPLAYIGKTTTVKSVITADNNKYIEFVRKLLSEQDKEDQDYGIAISIGIKTKKENTFDSVGVHYENNGIPVTLTEEDILKRFPWTYKTMVAKCRERYSDFKQDKKFNILVSQIKTNDKLSKKRDFYPNNKKTPTIVQIPSKSLIIIIKRNNKCEVKVRT